MSIYSRVAAIIVAATSVIAAASSSATPNAEPLGTYVDCQDSCRDCQTSCQSVPAGSKNTDCMRACTAAAAGCCSAYGKPPPSGMGCFCQ
jgi:hypothetical protein